MPNYNLKLDLSKLKNACIKNLKAKSGEVKCLIIPIDDNNLFVSEKTGSIYLDCTCTELQAPKYEQTHFIKRRYTKEQFYQLDQEERKNIPILGNLSPQKEWNNNNTTNNGGYAPQQYPQSQTTTHENRSNNIDDLPF